MHAARAIAIALILTFTLLPASASPAPGASTLVGAAGNEPLVRVAHDGTVYVAALQDLECCFDGCTGVAGTFCDGMTLALPQGTRSVHVWIDPDGVGAAYCPNALGSAVQGTGTIAFGT